MSFVVLPQRPGQFPAAGLKRIKFLFSFCDSYLSAAVPAFYMEIGIPALSRKYRLCFCSRNCVHEFPPAQWAVDRAQSTHQSIVFSLLFLLLQRVTLLSVDAKSDWVEWCDLKCCCYSTISVSHPATGRDRRRAFRYAISKVRQVLPR